VDKREDNDLRNHLKGPTVIMLEGIRIVTSFISTAGGDMGQRQHMVFYRVGYSEL